MSEAGQPAVRAEKPDDAAAISALIAAAFGRRDEAALVERLRRAKVLDLSLVAERGGALAGQVALSPCSVQGAFMPGILGLAPLAVHPDHQRQGIGTALVRAALEAAKQSGGKLILVLGEPAYYGRFGFRRAKDIGLTCPWPGTDEAFQALTLASPWPRGLVRYHSAFDAL